VRLWQVCFQCAGGWYQVCLCGADRQASREQIRWKAAVHGEVKATILYVKVCLRNPSREVELDGPMKVGEILVALHVNPESVIVIRDDELLTKEMAVADADSIELRPVISGGGV